MSRSEPWPSAGLAAAALAAAAAVPVAAAPAGTHSYYVGVDDFPTLSSGTYAGQPNPNFNHLTLLWAHFNEANPAGNHYHSKAIFTYSGPAAAPTVVNSASNYVPEGSNPPLKLSPGTGLYAGKLVSAPYADPAAPSAHFSDLTLGNTRSLEGFGPTDGRTYMFNSSGGRWNSTFDAADVHWELVSLTPGLHVGDATTLDIASDPGDDVHVGGGDELFEFTPVLWTDAAAAPGDYAATFRLVDESGTFGPSGAVEVRTSVVPEPAGLGLLAAGGLGLLGRRRRRAVPGE